MTPASHIHAALERNEPDNPVNGLLDAIDVQVRALVAMGYEEQLRNRMARLLPPPAGNALLMTSVLNALREASQLRMPEKQRARIHAARQIVLNAIGRC